MAPETEPLEETVEIPEKGFNQVEDPVNNKPESNPELEKLEKMLIDLKEQKAKEEFNQRNKAQKSVIDKNKKEDGKFVVHRFGQRSVPPVETLNQLFEEKLFVDKHTNSVVVAVTSDIRGASISNVLAFLDTPSGRTLYRVEGVVVNASLTDSDDFSIEWLAKYQSPEIPFPTVTAGSGPGFLGLQSQYLDLAVDKAKTSGVLSVLARPSLILAPGETASISSGREVPIPVANTQDGNVTSSVDYLTVALSLEVSLEEIGNDQISLSITQINASVTGETIIDDNIIPEVSSQEWKTQIQPDFGKWYAIGGVNSESESDSETKGWIFRNRKSKSQDRREVGMFIRVVPVVSTDPPSMLSQTRLLPRAIPIYSK